jgi:hypothetical protein
MLQQMLLCFSRLVGLLLLALLLTLLLVLLLSCSQCLTFFKVGRALLLQLRLLLQAQQQQLISQQQPALQQLSLWWRVPQLQHLLR